jgi:hypothetical protein
MPSGMGTTVLPRPLGSHYLVVFSRCVYLQRMSSSRRSPCKTARLRRTAGVSLVAMPNLQLPTSEVRESFLSAMAELAAERRGAPDDHTMIGHEIRTFGGSGARPRASRRACGRCAPTRSRRRRVWRAGCPPARSCAGSPSPFASHLGVSCVDSAAETVPRELRFLMRGKNYRCAPRSPPARRSRAPRSIC